MTIENDKNGVAFTCDCCGDTWTPPKLGHGSEKRDFAESWELAKEDGWRAVQVRSLLKGAKPNYEHRCENCA